MVDSISATDLSRNLSEILTRIQHRGESFTVVRNGRTIASLSPIVSSAARPRGSFRSFADRVRHLPIDPAFADDLAEIQRSQDLAESLVWPSSRDTSVLIAIERGQMTADDVAALLPDDDTALASISASELLAGVHQAEPGRRREHRSLVVEMLSGELARARLRPTHRPRPRTHRF